MAKYGHCPSGRLFEAASCGTPILSDTWDGLDEFFEPGKEIIVARTTEEAVDAMQTPAAELARIGYAARKRALGDHSAQRRAEQLLEAIQ